MIVDIRTQIPGQPVGSSQAPDRLDWTPPRLRRLAASAAEAKTFKTKSRHDGFTLAS